jgi:hypothetical protein
MTQQAKAEGAKKKMLRVDRDENTGIEFEALLKTQRSTKAQRSKSVETPEVDRSSKKLR